MMTLVEQMLDLSQLEAGQLRLAAEPVDLPEIIEELRQDVAPRMAAQGLELQIELAPSLPPALGDARRLRQIVRNLVDNAVKFTETGSVRITACATKNGVDIAVRDTGIGMNEEAMRYVFEAFRQLDSGTSRPYGGAGLGLAIARQLAEQMDGSISVVSTPQVGSTFTLHLPAATADTPSRRSCDG